MEQVGSARRRRWVDASVPATAGQWSMGDRWPLLVSVLVDEQADFLRALQDHLVQPGGRSALQQALLLQNAADRLQRAGRHAQQITRLASGQVRQFRERIDLCKVVRAVLADLGMPAGAASIAAIELAPADTFMDASAAYTVVECLLAWLQVHGRGLVLKTEPGRGGCGPVLSAGCQRAAPPVAVYGAPPRRRLDDGLELLLLQQAAWANGLTLRIVTGAGITARVGFPPAPLDADALGRIEFPARQAGSSRR